MSEAPGYLKKRVGLLIRAHSKAKGWTRQNLAEESGTSADMLAKIEGGSSGASFATVEKLAAALQVDPSAFFGAGPYESKEWSELHGMMALVANEPPATQTWLIGIIAAALKPNT